MIDEKAQKKPTTTARKSYKKGYFKHRKPQKIAQKRGEKYAFRGYFTLFLL